MVVLVGLGTCEIAWRLVRGGGVHMPPAYWVPDHDLLFRRHGTLPGAMLRGGDPGPKRPGTLRVMCLGGSTTFGHGVKRGEAWPGVLEELLRASGVDVEVINAGVPGYGSRQLLAWYERDLAALDADVVVLYEGWNRTGAIVDPGQFVPYGIVRPGDAALKRLGARVADHSLLYRDGFAASLKLWKMIAGTPWTMDRFHDTFVADMRALIGEVRRHGQRVVVVVYPALYFDGMTPAEVAAYEPHLWERRRFRPEMLVELHRKHDALRQLAREADVPLVDVAASFENVHGADRLALFLDEAHPSVAGNRRVAETIATALRGILVPTGGREPLTPRGTAP